MTAAAVCCQFTGHLFAQTSLSLSSAVGSPDVVTNLNLSVQVVGTAPAGLQWTLAYSPGQVLAIAASAGPATIAAGKELSCVSTNGLYKCLLTGLNSNPIASGTVAYVQIVVAPYLASSSIAISDVLGVDATATALGISTNIGATVIVPVLSSLTCVPAVLNSGSSANCSVTMNSVVPAGGIPVALSTDNPALSVPASVTVPAGQTSTGFTAVAGPVSGVQTATLTGRWNGGSTSSSLSLLPQAGLPTISSLSPGGVAAGSHGFVLIVNGTAFRGDGVIQWNGTPLTTTFVDAEQLKAVVPADLIATPGIATITIFEPGGVTSNAVIFTVIGSAPSINAGGVVPIYSSVASIQAGSWVSIFGNNLAYQTLIWNGDFPTSLGGVTVSVDDKPAYLLFVSPGQINIQTPDDAALGTVTVMVTTPFGTATSAVTLSQFAPSFIRFDTRYAAGVILTPDGSGAYGNGTYDLLGPSGYFSFSTRPATEGDTLELYGVGFGPTTPAVPAGKPSSGAAPVNNTVTVTIGGVSADVLFAGVTSTGLYQLNIIVPTVGSGDQVLQASVGGVSTPTLVYVAIK